ncbi:hypothetical protein GCM10010521_02950 [Streptomyces rameus]|uniref:Uncharacterized protein n=1 Tax=Streptomyces rameus TaxID=68261 RepID=A0ABP6MNB0_9ACTN
MPCDAPACAADGCGTDRVEGDARGVRVTAERPHGQSIVGARTREPASAGPRPRRVPGPDVCAAKFRIPADATARGPRELGGLGGPGGPGDIADSVRRNGVPGPGRSHRTPDDRR